METNAVDSKASKPPFSRRRLFRWGIGFWIVVWIVSVFRYQSFSLYLKGSRGVDFRIEGGAMTCDVQGEKMLFSKIGPLEHRFISARDLKRIQQDPGLIATMFAKGGWTIRTHGPTLVSFPTAGFLWAWLAAGWVIEIKLRRRENAGVKGNSPCVPLPKHRLTVLTSVLIALGLAISYFSIRGQQAFHMEWCMLNLRNIQQAVRGHGGVRGLRVGAPLVWDEIIGVRGYLSSENSKCPSGEDYQLAPFNPAEGEFAANCPHPDHQRRLRSMDTSDW